MNTIQGDLIALALAGRFDVIVHGCNCRHAMDAGIARQIKAAFPEAYAADLATPKDAGKLGTISTAEIERGGVRFTVANAYTQDHWQGAGVLADYAAIRVAFAEIARRYPDKRIAYPKIGSGLAKGDWPTIAAIIEEELAGCAYTLVEYAPRGC